MRKLFAILAVTVLMSAASAWAGTVQLGGWTDGTGGITIGSSSFTVYLGAVPAKFDTGLETLLYCVSDLNISLGQGALPYRYTYVYTGPFSMNTEWAAVPQPNPPGGTNLNGQRASWLYINFAADATTSEKQAALQLAIWNAVWDTDFTLASGNFKSSVSGSLLTTAQGYLTALGTAQTAGEMGSVDASYYRLFKNGVEQQGFIGPVPEPALILLLGLGIGGVFVVSRRMTK